MHVWTIVTLLVVPDAAAVPPPVLIQRHFASALTCERSAERAVVPPGLRLVCVPSGSATEVLLAEAF